MTVQGRSPSTVDGALASHSIDIFATTDIGSLVQEFPGPAALFDSRGQLLSANSAAGPMADKNEMFLGELGALISSVAQSGQAVTHRLHSAIDDTGSVLDLALMPLTGGPGLPVSVLVLGRDSTFDVNLATALISSRRLFQDLVACSVDFAWETKPDGRFSFVSARGALGYTAEELNGRVAHELLHEDSAGTDIVFEVQEPIDDREIWLRRANGEAACMRVSAMPVFDQDNRWLATRGVCRDITEAKARDAALAQAREREMLIRSVVDTIRRVIAPEDIFTGAAEQVSTTTGAQYAAVIRPDSRGNWDIVAEVRAGAAGLLNDDFLDPDGDPSVDHLVAFSIGDSQQLAAPCRYHDETKGWLCLVRTPAHEADDHTSELLATVADHLGIAMAQADVQAKLERLSRIDELTGLLNRRAFRETAIRRLAHHRRTGRTGALLFIDMDNFKAVNDVRGHQAGDDALRTLAKVLGGGDNRQGDIVARLGGDEFALWLEETDRKGALQLAERLLQRCGVLKKFSGTPEKPLSISIGVVVSQPGRSDSLDKLIEQADEAMYEAKRSGKGRIVVVEPK